MKVHTGASRAVRLSVSFSISLSARLSLVGTLFLFSMPMTMSTHPVGSLCTHGSDLPFVPECVGLGPFVGWRIVRFMQKQLIVQVFMCTPPLGMKCACTGVDGQRGVVHSQ